MYSMMLCMWGPSRSGWRCSSCTRPVHTGFLTSVLGSCASANKPARYLQPPGPVSGWWSLARSDPVQRRLTPLQAGRFVACGQARGRLCPLLDHAPRHTSFPRCTAHCTASRPSPLCVCCVIMQGACSESANWVEETIGADVPMCDSTAEAFSRVMVGRQPGAADRTTTP